MRFDNPEVGDTGPYPVPDDEGGLWEAGVQDVP